MLPLTEQQIRTSFVNCSRREAARDEIVERMESFENAAIRFVASQTLDHLCPKGSKEVAAKIKAIVDKNAESGDQNKIQADYPLKQVMYRIETRAN